MTNAYTPFRIDTTYPPVETERIELFWIDDRCYDAPATVSGPTALKALQWLAQQGPQYASYMVLIDCIGQEAYDDLTKCEHLTLDQVRDMVEKITDLYFGQTLDALGK